MSITLDYSGKVALVTGAARGIGEAAARALAEAGAAVLLVDLLPEVEQTAASISDAGGEASAFVGDLGQEANCQSMVETVKSRYGRLDFAFNNAGVGGEPGPLHLMGKADWQAVLDVNLTSMFCCIKHEVATMLDNDGGLIINTSSICGKRSVSQFTHYNATKHGVVSLSKQVAVEYADQGIRCIAIAPGFVDTAMTQKSTSEVEGLREQLESKIPLGRLAQPEDIGRVVRLLCSDDASYINGAYLPIDGGMLEV